MLDKSVFARRRAAYMDAIGPDAVAVIHSPPEAIRNGDVQFPFRQSSDLYYLTGFAEPDATLVLRPAADPESESPDERARVVLFVRPRDPERETWDGRRAGVEGAVSHYGADAAHPSDLVANKLAELIANADELHYGLGIDHAFDRVVTRTIARLRNLEKRGKRPPRAVVDPRAVLHEMRLRKSPEELGLLREAAAISADAHRAAMAKAAPGVSERQLEALIDYTFRDRGGSGPGYNTIVGAGANATILHYIENDRDLADGDLVLIDAGCEYGYYTADITRTFPVSGRFSDAQRRCYEIVLHAQKTAVSMVKPGETIDGIHARVVELLTEGMVDLGLLEGPASARVEDESYKKFYMHRTSHWLGMDVHDVGAYTVPGGAARPLEPGMVITVEPGLYIAEDDEDAPEELRGIGVRIEDDVLVTRDGHDNLTAAAPKEIEDVEAACRG